METETRRRLMQDTVVRCASPGRWYLMNKKALGWSTSAVGPYASTLEIFQEWAITYGPSGTDEHGDYIEVHAK